MSYKTLLSVKKANKQLKVNISFKCLSNIVLTGCTGDAATSACAIPMSLRSVGTRADLFGAYDAWRVGDRYFDWYGKEAGQGSFNGWQPDGTPGVWTTNDKTNAAYNPLNTLVKPFSRSIKL